MSTLQERYDDASDHFRETPHKVGQQEAYTRVDNAYKEFTEHEGNLLLQGSTSRRNAQRRTLEEALDDYERFRQA